MYLNCVSILKIVVVVLLGSVFALIEARNMYFCTRNFALDNVALNEFMSRIFLPP